MVGLEASPDWLVYSAALNDLDPVSPVEAPGQSTPTARVPQP